MYAHTHTHTEPDGGSPSTAALRQAAELGQLYKNQLEHKEKEVGHYLSKSVVQQLVVLYIYCFIHTHTAEY